MKLIIICILINIIALITSSLKKRSRSKSKRQFFIRRPYIVRHSPLLVRRTIVTPRPVFAVVRPAVVECPVKKGNRVLIGKSTGICKTPCNMKSCIQTSAECCFYAKPE